MQVKVKDHLTYCPVLLMKTTHIVIVPCLSTATIQLFFSFSVKFFFLFFVTQNFPFTLLSPLTEIFLFPKQSNIFHPFSCWTNKGWESETDWLYCPCSLFGSFSWATRFLQWGLNTRYVIWCLWPVDVRFCVVDMINFVHLLLFSFFFTIYRSYYTILTNFCFYQ